MPEVVTCPQCERQLRVPDELVGQRVKCPTCGSNFTATVSGTAAMQPESQGDLPREPQEALIGETSRNEPDHHRNFELNQGANLASEELRRRARNKLIIPAIFLIILGALGILLYGAYAFRAVTVALPPMEELVKQNPNFKGKEAELESYLKIIWGPVGAAWAGLFAFLNLMMVIAGIAMLAGRARWLAILGSVLGVVNISCCCIFALPFGLWSLIVLFNEDVKNSFR
jgi:hypothetical protein